MNAILAFFIGFLTALPGAVGDRIRFERIVCCSGVLGSSFYCGVFGGVCCCGVLGGCTWVLQNFQRIAAFKHVVVASKFVEGSCLMFLASVVIAVSLSNQETHRLQQKCGEPSPSWMLIWPIALNCSAILAVFPVVENSAFLLVKGTALPHVLQ